MAAYLLIESDVCTGLLDITIYEGFMTHSIPIADLNTKKDELLSKYDKIFQHGWMKRCSVNSFIGDSVLCCLLLFGSGIYMSEYYHNPFWFVTVLCLAFIFVTYGGILNYKVTRIRHTYLTVTVPNAIDEWRSSPRNKYNYQSSEIRELTEYTPTMHVQPVYGVTGRQTGTRIVDTDRLSKWTKCIKIVISNL